MNKYYDCRMCINHSTPLCEHCTEIFNSKGYPSPPTYYVDGRRQIKSCFRQEELSQIITVRLSKKKRIPLAMVMEYNQLDDSE